jgi:hypothetical protein
MKQALTLFLYFILTLGLSGGFAVYGPAPQGRQRAQTEVISFRPQTKRLVSFFYLNNYLCFTLTYADCSKFETQRLTQLYKLSHTHRLDLFQKLGYHYSFKASELPRC